MKNTGRTQINVKNNFKFGKLEANDKFLERH